MPEHKYERNLRELSAAMKVLLAAPKTFTIPDGRKVTTQVVYVRRVSVLPDQKRVVVLTRELGTPFVLIDRDEFSYDMVFSLEDIEKRIKILFENPDAIVYPGEF